ncbi:13802_t:CDS:1, partial [Acaulospora colombiana]
SDGALVPAIAEGSTPRRLPIDDIKSYDYTDFKNIEHIGVGAFGKVYSADWETRGIQVALKTLNERNDIEEEDFIKE